MGRVPRNPPNPCTDASYSSGLNPANQSLTGHEACPPAARFWKALQGEDFTLPAQVSAERAPPLELAVTCAARAGTYGASPTKGGKEPAEEGTRQAFGPADVCSAPSPQTPPLPQPSL